MGCIGWFLLKWSALAVIIYALYWLFVRRPQDDGASAEDRHRYDDDLS